MAGTMTAHLFRCTRPVERDLEELRTVYPGEACQEAYKAVIAADQGTPGLTPGIDFRIENLHGLAERHSGDVVQELVKPRQDIHVAAAIKAGSLNLDGSYKYRPLDDYLISRERWEREKQEVLERAGLADFDDPVPVPGELETVLQRQYEATNRAASDGSNPVPESQGSGQFPGGDARPR